MPHTADPEKVESRHLVVAIQSSGQFSGKKVLDVGCGNGAFTREFAEQFPCNIFGIDPSFGNLEKAQSGSGEDRICIPVKEKIVTYQKGSS
jgi:ubiquinone/menaquinone biosynthesis C-methylase UbiE